MALDRLQSQGAERALVARLLLSPELVGDTSGLKPEEFSIPDLGRVYSSLMRRHADGKPFDVVTVQDDTGVEVNVLELSPASFASVKEYVNVIKDAAIRRSIVGTLDRARVRIAADDADPLGVLATALDTISLKTKATGLRDSAEVVRAYSDEFKRRGAGLASGISYGVPALDATLLPMRPGRLVVFASRPGVGKTALAESVSDHAANYGPVLFVSLEMGAEELTDRALARLSGYKAGDIMRGRVSLEDLDSHLKARSDLPITYLDEGMTTTADILSAANRVKMKYGELGLIIVDYLQLVADKGEHEVYRVGAIAHALKRMAMSLKVPVLSLAQLNRAIESDNRAPRLSDLRDSGAIEQDADTVVIITGTPMKPERDLHILKQRQGRTGRVSLMFEGDTQRWSGTGEGEW